jgi:hypothetical protein
MTDRLKGCVVQFSESIREDDAQAVLDAIKMIKGVQSVAASVDSSDDWINRERIRHELGQRILDVIFPERLKTGGESA